MKHRTWQTTSLWALGLGVLLILVGCSSFDDPVGTPQAEPDAQEQATLYPVWTDEQIEDLIPGFHVLTVDSRASGREALDDQSSRFIRRTQGGTVQHRNNGVQIGAWQLWEDRTVTVSTPNPGRAIVDFYPHPYQFNGHVRIWIDLTYVQLPPGRNWWDIQMFYVDDNGNLVPYWGYVDEGARQYIAWTDHFSRYIIGLKAQ
ncbi:hypothetical protein KKH27_04250 [bacterium]|nr:hypothetical protein [bacterium]MBU1982833.1 hypothetical protein [bacterium]